MIKTATPMILKKVILHWNYSKMKAIMKSSKSHSNCIYCKSQVVLVT